MHEKNNPKSIKNEMQETEQSDAFFFDRGLAASKGFGYGLILHIMLSESLLAGLAGFSVLSVVELYYVSAVSRLKSIRESVMKVPESND